MLHKKIQDKEIEIISKDEKRESNKKHTPSIFSKVENHQTEKLKMERHHINPFDNVYLN